MPTCPDCNAPLEYATSKAGGRYLVDARPRPPHKAVCKKRVRKAKAAPLVKGKPLLAFGKNGSTEAEQKALERLVQEALNAEAPRP